MQEHAGWNAVLAVTLPPGGTRNKSRPQEGTSPRHRQCGWVSEATFTLGGAGKACGMGKGRTQRQCSGQFTLGNSLLHSGSPLPFHK